MATEWPIRPELPEMLGKDRHLRERRCLENLFSVLDLDPGFAMGLFSKSLPSLMSLFVSKLQRVFLATREEIPVSSVDRQLRVVLPRQNKIPSQGRDFGDSVHGITAPPARSG